MSYATPADLVLRYDSRTLADLASDSGVPAADLNTAARVLAALEDASGRVDAAVMIGKQYLAADLAGLTGNSLALLKRITCDVAMAYLLGTRPEKFGQDDVAAAHKSAEDFLDRLRKGERLFVVEAVQDAGNPTVDGPTAVTYERLNLLPDRTRHYYPSRGGRLPLGRG